MGGPVGGGLAAWWPIFLAGAVVLLVLVLIGGGLAAAVGRRGSGFILGVVAYVVAAWWLRVRWDLAGEDALLWGFAASLAAGAALLAASRVREERRSLAVALVWIVTLGLAVLGVVSTTAHQRDEDRVVPTRVAADDVAVSLGYAEADQASQLADVVPWEVVEASGSRSAGGAVLVVRITQADGQGSTATRCWRYRVEGDEPVDGPDAVDCPTSPPAGFDPAYSDDLVAAVEALPPADQTDPEAVRNAVEQVAAVRVTGRAVVEADGRDGDVFVATQAGINQCMLTLIRAAGGVDRIHTVQATPAGPDGCHPDNASFEGF
jgi:hypothetical protein